MGLSVRELGEHGLLQLIKPFCSAVVGDDGAIMGSTASGRQMVVTTDLLIDGVHFSPITTSAQDAGWRAAAANLSDLAAMGALPWGMVLGLGLPPDTDVDWVIGVYEGFTDCLQRYGTALVGGDTVRSPITTLAVTAFGQVRSDQIIQRHTAEVGDLIVITGEHGLSKAGLEILLDPELAKNLTQAAIAQLHKAHQRPIPRFDVLPFIFSQQTNQSIRASGMDSSDGLADAIAQICQASQVGARLNQIPIPELVKLVAGDRAHDWMMYGGEDFELVLCLPPELAHNLIINLPSAAIVGEIIAEENIQNLDLTNSFQHFNK
jgi:thiamine-monophosphate kinase